MNKRYINTCLPFIIILFLCESLHGVLNFVEPNQRITEETIKQNIIPTPEPEDTSLTKLISDQTIKKVDDESIENSSDQEEELIEFHFEDADIKTLISQVETLYNVRFITDDIISPLPEGRKNIAGNKISFKTYKPLSRTAAWNLFITFLEIAGFSLSKKTEDNTYRIVTLEAARKSPIPAYIGTKPAELPENDQMIRYVYFVENSTLDTLEPIIESLRSTVSGFKSLKDLQAFVLTDKSYNIKSLMEIIKELDKVTMPQSMSVLKLRRADATEVKKLYDTLTQSEDKGVSSRLFPARKTSTAMYFPENTRIIADSRTNTLILLGSDDSIKKIEEFITSYIDVELVAPYSPVRIHNLKHADATRVAEIMNNMTDFGKSTEAGKSGGVRGGDKYMKKMVFTPEPETNRLIIQGDEEDYLRVKDILNKLDEPQPQVAIEVLILNLTLNNNKQLGAQIRKKIPGPNGLLGDNVTFQTSGLYGGSAGIQTKSGSGAERLLADLISLAVGAPAGNTLISLGSDAMGVWGMFQALQTVSNTQVISNPFLVATNKTPAKVSIGEVRRVVVSTVVGTSTEQSRDDLTARIEVNITPQINSDGMIILDLEIDIDQFTDTVNREDATRNIKKLKTSTIVANGEVLALGGLIQNRENSNMSKTPVLGDIPIFGWLFKNKGKTETKDNLLIMITTRILPPDSDKEADNFTDNRIIGYQTTLGQMLDAAKKDPIGKSFFEDKKNSSSKIVEDFIFKRKDGKIKEDQPHEVVVRGQESRKRSHRNRFKKKSKEKKSTQGETNTQDNSDEKNESAAPQSPQWKRKSIADLVTDTEAKEVTW